MKRLCASLFLFSCLACGAARAAEPELEIQWFDPDFPPFFISNGVFAGKGAGDQIEAFVMRELPQYRHVVVRANLARREVEARARDLVCSSAVLLTPARENSMELSRAYISILPNGATILRSKEGEMRPFINARGELRLDAWLASKRYMLSAAAGRSFGPVLDGFMQAEENAAQISRFKGSDAFASGLLQLSNQQGADALLGYAVELSWTIHRLGLKAEDFRFLPIEGATALQPAYFGCSRSPEAREVVVQIDALIDSGALPKLAHKLYAEWLPEDAAAHFEAMRKAGRKSH